jgi:hypothetical protein
MRIRELGEKLDAHRKERQALHPGLTLTGMYNVLEKLRAGEPLSDKDRKIHDEGLVSILKQIHDDLDAAVFKAYGWEDLSERRLSERRISTGEEDSASAGAQRDASPGEGLVRWLRPEYQSGGDLRSPLQTHLSYQQFHGPPAPPPSSRRSANFSPPPARTPALSPPASARRPRQESTRSRRSWRRYDHSGSWSEGFRNQ